MQVFSPEWFIKHKYRIVRFANTMFGRSVLGLPNLPIVSVSPGGYSFIKEIDISKHVMHCEYRGYSDARHAERLRKYGYPFWSTLHFIDSLILDRQNFVPNFGFNTWGPTINYYSGSLDSSDGGYPGYSWSNLRSGSGYTIYLYSPTMQPSIGTSIITNDWFSIKRGCFFIDTSGLTDSCISISSGTVDGYCTQKSNNLTSDPAIALVYPNVASVPNLATSDFTRFTTTRLAPDLYFSSHGTGGWTWSWSLNSTGLNTTYLNRTGYSQYGLMNVNDIENNPPAWSNYKSDYATFTGARVTIDYEHLVKVNINDVWKDVSSIQVNIGDTWKFLSELKINISDVWKTVF